MEYLILKQKILSVIFLKQALNFDIFRNLKTVRKKNIKIFASIWRQIAANACRKQHCPIFYQMKSLF